MAAGDDGLSGFQRDGAWGGYREEITRFSQILFSGRPGQGGDRIVLVPNLIGTQHETIVRFDGPTTSPGPVYVTMPVEIVVCEKLGLAEGKNVRVNASRFEVRT